MTSRIENRWKLVATVAVLAACFVTPASGCPHADQPPGSLHLAEDQCPDSPEQSGGCPEGCSDCSLPCCLGPVIALGFLTPAPPTAPAPDASRTVPAIERGWMPAPMRLPDHPPRA